MSNPLLALKIFSVIALLQLLLSRFSRVQLCATPDTAAHQAPPSLGFSRQEPWSGVPFPSPTIQVRESEVAQSCLTLCDPMDCSLPGSSVHGIFQARVLEWVAISFCRGSSQTKIKPISPALTGRFFTTESPGKSLHYSYSYALYWRVIFRGMNTSLEQSV